MKPTRTRSVRRSFQLIEGLVALLLGFLALQVYLQWQASHRGVQALARLETGAIPGLKLVAELEENLILYRLRSYELMFVPEQQRPAKTAEADALRETLRRVLSDLGERLPDETARRHRARLEQGLTNYFALDSRIRSTLDKDFQAAMDLLDKEVPEAVRQLEEASHTLQKHCSDYASHETRDTVTAFADTKATVVVMNAVGMAFALAVLVLVAITSRGIRAALVDVAHRLSDGSRRTGELAGTVASASHVLAEGASEQAAAIEETGASLEEMASMTAQSASNAAAVHECMQKEAAENFARIEDRLRRMDETLTLTLAAGHETAKVIRVIDEIAFQTNILALNAAVEAARAGDAGLGFAVVADEVRNLAQRSASAAKSTQGMVENSTLRLKELAAHFREISDALGTNTALGRKISELVAQISVASQEQAQGIRQITSAVAGMEKITQQNVAHAQSSTAAARDLHEQADHVQDTVAGLMGLVDGRGTPAGPDSPSSTDHADDLTHAHAAPANGAARPSRPGPGSHGAARERFTFVPASPAPGGANGGTPTVLHG